VFSSPLETVKWSKDIYEDLRAHNRVYGKFMLQIWIRDAIIIYVRVILVDIYDTAVFVIIEFFYLLGQFC
jgi:hypothetical protein